MVLLGTSLAFSWQNPEQFSKFGVNGKQAVAIILLMGFCSAVTVVCDLGFRKSFRPNLLVPVVVENSASAVLIVTIHSDFNETGEMMGLAWEFKFSNLQINPSFLLLHSYQDHKTSSNLLQNTIQDLPKPLDLWLVNFEQETDLNKCVADSQSFPSVNGYKYKHLRCS